MNYHSNNTNLLLEQYLDGDLSVEEADRIKKLLEADPALREELEAMILSIEAVRHKGLYARVKAIRNEMLQQGSEKKPARLVSLVRRSMRIAAAILLLAGAFAVYKYVSVTNTSVYNDLYLQYEPARTRSVQTDPAETAYQQKNWEEVIALAERNPGNNKNLFLAGIVGMETGNFPAAISRFETILQQNIKSGSDLFNDEAEYYLALAHLRIGEPSRASARLHKISQTAGHLYREKAAAASGINLKILEWKDK